MRINIFISIFLQKKLVKEIMRKLKIWLQKINRKFTSPSAFRRIFILLRRCSRTRLKLIFFVRDPAPVPGERDGRDLAPLPLCLQ